MPTIDFAGERLDTYAVESGSIPPETKWKGRLHSLFRTLKIMFAFWWLGIVFWDVLRDYQSSEKYHNPMLPNEVARLSLMLSIGLTILWMDFTKSRRVPDAPRPDIRRVDDEK